MALSEQMHRAGGMGAIGSEGATPRPNKPVSPMKGFRQWKWHLGEVYVKAGRWANDWVWNSDLPIGDALRLD